MSKIHKIVELTTEYLIDNNDPVGLMQSAQDLFESYSSFEFADYKFHEDCEVLLHFLSGICLEVYSYNSSYIKFCNSKVYRIFGCIPKCIYFKPIEQ